jgi:hypothetical protein
LCTIQEINRALGDNAQKVHDEHVMFVQTCQAEAGFTSLNYLDNLLMFTKKREKKPDPILPPVPAFKIDRIVPNNGVFEEDLKYFDLPGKMSEDFDVSVKEKVSQIDGIKDDTREALVKLLMEYKSIFHWYSRDQRIRV